MPGRRRDPVPSLLERVHPRDAARKLAFVSYLTPDGRRRQKVMGDVGSPKAERSYRQFLKDYLAGVLADEDRRAKTPAVSSSLPEITIESFAARFLRWADGYYRKNGEPTKEAHNHIRALRPVLRLYGDEPASAFGPRKLREAREVMIEMGWCRNEVNKGTKRVVRAFAWGVEHELIPPTVLEGIRAVKSLRKGKNNVRESEPVGPVAWDLVEPVLPLVSRQVRAMILLQWHTGMRADEVWRMRTGDLDTRSVPWIYTPGSHKTEHHGKVLQKQLGPQAREVLRPFLKADPGAYLFCPREAEDERQAHRRANRKTPMTPSQAARRPKVRPERQPGEHYTTDTYRLAIHRACRTAGIEQWSPGRLRHSYATRMRAEVGAERTQTLMGHSRTRYDADLRRGRSGGHARHRRAGWVESVVQGHGIS